MNKTEGGIKIGNVVKGADEADASALLEEVIAYTEANWHVKRESVQYKQRKQNYILVHINNIAHIDHAKMREFEEHFPGSHVTLGEGRITMKVAFRSGSFNPARLLKQMIAPTGASGAPEDMTLAEFIGNLVLVCFLLAVVFMICYRILLVNKLIVF